MSGYEGHGRSRGLFVLDRNGWLWQIEFIIR